MAPELEEFDTIPPPGPTLWVRRLKREEMMVFTTVSDRIWGVTTHWGNNRSSPHLRNKKECPGCKAGFPMRPKLYLHVYNETAHRQEILELTPFMAKQLEDQLGKEGAWRGQRFNCKRGKGDKARCALTLLCHYDALKRGTLQIPQQDPKKILLELWGWSDAAFGDEPETVIPMPQAI